MSSISIATIKNITEMVGALQNTHEALIGDGCFHQTEDFKKWSEMMTEEIEEIKSRDIDEMDQDDIYESLCDGGYQFPSMMIEDMTKEDILEHLKMNGDCDWDQCGEIKSLKDDLAKEVCSSIKKSKEIDELKRLMPGYEKYDQCRHDLLGTCLALEGAKEEIEKIKAEHKRDYVYPKIIADAHDVTKMTLEAVIKDNENLKTENRRLEGIASCYVDKEELAHHFHFPNRANFTEDFDWKEELKEFKAEINYLKADNDKLHKSENQPPPRLVWQKEVAMMKKEIADIKEQLVNHPKQLVSK